MKHTVSAQQREAFLKAIQRQPKPSVPLSLPASPHAPSVLQPLHCNAARSNLARTYGGKVVKWRSWLFHCENLSEQWLFLGNSSTLQHYLKAI